MSASRENKLKASNQLIADILVRELGIGKNVLEKKFGTDDTTKINHYALMVFIRDHMINLDDIIFKSPPQFKPMLLKKLENCMSKIMELDIESVILDDFTFRSCVKVGAGAILSRFYNDPTNPIHQVYRNYVAWLKNFKFRDITSPRDNQITKLGVIDCDITLSLDEENYDEANLKSKEYYKLLKSSSTFTEEDRVLYLGKYYLHKIKIAFEASDYDSVKYYLMLALKKAREGFALNIPSKAYLIKECTNMLTYFKEEEKYEEYLQLTRILKKIIRENIHLHIRAQSTLPDDRTKSLLEKLPKAYLESTLKTVKGNASIIKEMIWRHPDLADLNTLEFMIQHKPALDNQKQQFLLNVSDIDVLLPILDKYNLKYHVFPNTFDVIINVYEPEDPEHAVPLVITTHRVQLAFNLDSRYLLPKIAQAYQKALDEKLASNDTPSIPPEVASSTSTATTAPNTSQTKSTQPANNPAAEPQKLTKKERKAAKKAARTERIRAASRSANVPTQLSDDEIARGIFKDAHKTKIYHTPASYNKNIYVQIDPALHDYLISLDSNGPSILKDLENMLYVGHVLGNSQGRKGIILSTNKFSPQQQDADCFVEIKNCRRDERLVGEQWKKVKHPKLGWCLLFNVSGFKPTHKSDEVIYPQISTPKS